jgi:hypothetical protein
MMVELVFDHIPEIDSLAIESLAQRSSPSARLVDASPQVMVSHDELIHTFDNGETASIKTALLSVDSPRTLDEMDLSHTWNFPEAEETLRSATSQIVVGEKCLVSVTTRRVELPLSRRC